MIGELRQPDASQFLHLPYRADVGNGKPNSGYFELVDNLDNLKHLNELDGFPELESLLRLINGEGSHFVTLRLDSSVDFYTRPGFTRSVAAFITLAFQIAGGNILSNSSRSCSRMVSVNMLMILP